MRKQNHYQDFLTWLRIRWDKGLASRQPVPEQIDINNLRKRDFSLAPRLPLQTSSGIEPSTSSTLPKALPSIPSLVQSLRDRDLQKRREAAIALGKIGAVALADMIEELNSKDPWLKKEALWALGNMSHRVPAALSYLIRDLEDPDEEVRCFALRALGKMGSWAYWANPHLEKIFQDSDKRTHAWAVWALGNINGQIPWAISQIQKFYLHPDERVRMEVVRIYAEIGRPAFLDLCKALHDPEDQVKWEAATALEEISSPELLTTSALRYLNQALRDEHFELRGRVAKILGKMGSTASLSANVLIQALKDKSDSVKKEIFQALTNMLEASLNQVLQSLEQGDSSIQMDLLLLLGRNVKKLQPFSQEILSSIEKILSTDFEPLRLWCQWVLSLFQKRSFDIQPFLKNEDDEISETALNIASEMGKEGLPCLREALKDPREEIRVKCMEVLQKQEESAILLLSDILESLLNPEEILEVKLHAFEILGEMKHHGDQILPSLRKLFQSNEDWILSYLLQTLERMGKASTLLGAEVVEVLLSTPDERIRRKAAKVLSSMDISSLPVLQEAYQRAPELAKIWLIWAQGTILGQTNQTVEELKNFLQHPIPAVRKETVLALEEIGPYAGDALLWFLRDSNRAVRSTAVQALNTMAHDCSQAVPYLITSLQDEDKWIRESATEALGKIGHKASMAVVYLAQNLYDPEEMVRQKAVQALGNVGEAALSVSQAIRQALYDENEIIRKYAAHALGQIGTKDPANVQALVAVLDDPAWQVKVEAAKSLGRMGPSAALAVPYLEGLLQDKKEEVVIAAARTLGHIGKEARSSSPQLLELMDTASDRSKMAIQFALEKVQGK